MANKPPDGIFLWDVGLGLEQKKINIAPKTHCVKFASHYSTPLLIWKPQQADKAEVFWY